MLAWETLFDGSTVVDTAAFFVPGMVTNNIVPSGVLDARIQQVIHAPPSDAGASDGGSATSPHPSRRLTRTSSFYLDKIQVDLGFGSQTCVEADGYHSYDGEEPYAVIPDCGRNRLAISHEMAEMCTDPQPGNGWYSDQDISNAGGEVGDLCNYPIIVDGQSATALWSNKDGDCEPQ